MIDNQLEKSQTSLMKGMLYKWYTITDNKEAYDNISKRSREYLLKSNSGISEEGFELQEHTLERIHQW